MYQILIADDDIMILEGICRIAKKACPDAVIHSAANGNIAMEIICTHHIDFVFTDIKMPICDGLELLEKLTQIKYQGTTVIISGFDDFEFVRKAMQLGATDYLLKPVSSQEFTRVLELCIQKVESNKQTEHFYSAESLQNSLEEMFMQQYLLSQILTQDTSVFAPILNEHQIHKSDDVLLFLLDIFHEFKHKDTEKQIYFLKTQTMLSPFTDSFQLVQGEYKRLWVVLLIGRKAKLEVSKSEVHRILTRMESSCTCAPCIPPIGLANDSFRETLLSMDKSFYDLEIMPITTTEVYPYTDLCHEIIEEICVYRLEHSVEKLRILFALFCLQKPLTADVKKVLTNLVYAIMTQNDAFIRIISKYKFTDFDVIVVIQDASSAHELYQKLVEIFTLYVDELQVKLNSHDDYAVQKAQDYIEKNYMTEISLGAISKQLGLHPNYFSTLFKQKAGMTYSAYVRHVRVQKAKELLKDTKRHLYDIAESIGYNDTAHFYRAFKEETGLTPAQYKKTQN